MTERFANLAERLSRIAFRSADWEEVTATITSSTFHYARFRDIDVETKQDKSFYLVAFSYTVNGQLFNDEYRRTESLDPGHKLAILYNPLKPSENNLSGSTRDSSLTLRITIWVIGAVLTAALAYLSHHYGWE